MNALAAWVERQPAPRRALGDLQRRIEASAGRRVRWQTLQLIARGASKPLPETARLIEIGTGGDVRAIELLGLTSGSACQPDAAVKSAEAAQ